MSRHRTRAALMALVAAGVAFFAATPVSAHENTGTMAAEARPAAQPSAVTARARVVYANDGHPADEASVTVTGTGPGGAQLAPTTLTRVDAGEYEGVVSLPAEGDWSLQFTSTNPAATAETAYAMRGPETTTPPSTATDRRRRATGSNDNDSSDLTAGVIAVSTGAVIAAAVVGGLFIVRCRR